MKIGEKESMKIGEKLKELANYYLVTRQAGHTTLMMKGVLSADKCVIITHNYSMAKCLATNWDLAKGAQLVSINSLPSLRGQKKPIVFDNCVLHMLFDDAAHEIERLEKENRALKIKLEEIKNIVK